MTSAWELFPRLSEICVPFEIKGILLICLIAVLWSHDWVHPMSCSQMGLIQALACAGIDNCHGK